VSRLVGAPPGYVGYEEGGQLTEAVRRRPYSIVLLDEIEKAHPDVFNMLLQMMEEGRLTDSFGRKVNFRNTILVMTSNVGSNLITSTTGLGFKQSTQDLNYEAMCGTLKEAIEGTFKPEFINRLDDIVYFQQLSRDDVAKIIDIELINVHERLKERGLHLSLADETREFLLDKGYSDVFGARPLKRAIEKYIEIPLSKELLRGGYKNGDNIKVVVGDDELAFVVEKVKKKRNVEM
jgi:ATP-dependent Clp protease ATP-binding subunit ClpC